MLIDSQIWIYYLDPNAEENEKVTLFMEGSHKNGVLFTEKIISNPVIPMEVAHSIFANLSLSIVDSYEVVTSIFNAENIELKDFDKENLFDGLKILANYRMQGIGGRDAMLLATMKKYNVPTLVTNDKNLLKLTELKRIDPIFDPPLVLEVEIGFDEDMYSNRKSEAT